MKKLLIIFYVLLPVLLHAQDSLQFKNLYLGNLGSGTAAFFPGGSTLWLRYLETKIHPNTPANNGAPAGNYVVTVFFIIDTIGNVTNVRLLKDPGYGIATDALQAFQHAPAWLPAFQQGRHVYYLTSQDITYQVTKK